MQRHAIIRCAWDDEASVWYVSESDISGLATEASSLEALRQKLPGMIQDLLDVDASTEIEVDLIACAQDRIRVEAD